MSARGEPIQHGSPASMRLFLAVAVSAVFVSVLTATMVNVLIPLIGARFGASAAEVGWVVTGYSLAYAIGVPLYGGISDFFGVRVVFFVGLAGFAVGGLICALAPSLAILVFGRIVQGVGGAAIPALAIVSVAKVLPAGERGAGIGLIGACLGAGAPVQPGVGKPQHGLLEGQRRHAASARLARPREGSPGSGPAAFSCMSVVTPL